MRKIFIIAAIIVLGMPLHAQDVYDGDNQGQPSVEPIESSRLQGPREATEAEKEYARRLAEDRAQQQQIDQNLPMIDENGQAITNNDLYYPYWDYGWGWNSWRLHKGLNVNIGASVFANFGDGFGHGAGFTQDISVMYVTNLSKKATLAVGGYFNNMIYGSNNYTSAGVNAVLGYRFNEHWSAYAFIQKAFTSDNFDPWVMAYGTFGNGWGRYGMAYSPIYAGWAYNPYMGYGYGQAANRFMDRIGGGVTYQWGEHNQNSISINVEVDRMPQPKNHFYNTQRFDYPVR